jgi:hypothetical protein
MQYLFTTTYFKIPGMSAKTLLHISGRDDFDLDGQPSSSFDDEQLADIEQALDSLGVDYFEESVGVYEVAAPAPLVKARLAGDQFLESAALGRAISG